MCLQMYFSLSLHSPEYSIDFSLIALYRKTFLLRGWQKNNIQKDKWLTWEVGRYDTPARRSKVVDDVRKAGVRTWCTV